MGEVGPTRPPDKLNIREMAILTVVLIKPAGVLQGFNNACHRNFIHSVHATLHRALHGRQHRGFTRRVAAVGKVIGKAKTAAGCANLPKHRGERHQHPVLLLAKLLALHPPAGHEHRDMAME